MFPFIWHRCQRSGYKQHIMVAQTDRWTCGMLKYCILVRGKKQVKNSSLSSREALYLIQEMLTCYGTKAITMSFVSCAWRN